MNEDIQFFNEALHTIRTKMEIHEIFKTGIFPQIDDQILVNLTNINLSQEKKNCVKSLRNHLKEVRKLLGLPNLEYKSVGSNEVYDMTISSFQVFN